MCSTGNGHGKYQLSGGDVSQFAIINKLIVYLLFAKIF
ncbi:hypothetical protein FTUN_7895 [Frigoriglobus tundricola]|uniref:Uncharacterized protein n=1 Tax=Frigoriglobus tundricola TaxID=2774151 RepID=A0A6M5Z1M9_9BACT|nr:hypothetical protein FTUN_7895 [Frigoriglobus tundricola]